MVSPTVEISHRIEFSASHRLHADALSEAENERIFGACHNTHGHNYELEVTVAGPVDPRTGMVMNLVDLMELLREKIHGRVDHRHLNDDQELLAGRVPTAETLVIAFWNELEPEIGSFESCRLVRMRLWESRSNMVEYRGPA